MAHWIRLLPPVYDKAEMLEHALLLVAREEVLALIGKDVQLVVGKVGHGCYLGMRSGSTVRYKETEEPMREGAEEAPGLWRYTTELMLSL